MFGSYAKLLLVDDRPTAYAQFGPLSAYPRAQRVRELYPKLPSSPLPAVITCIATTPAGYAVTFQAPSSGVRTLVAVTDVTVASPASTTYNRSSAWHNSQVADYVVVAPAAFHATLGTLTALRASQGHSVAVVDIEDVYDEFSFGQKTPYALRAFLQHADP